MFWRAAVALCLTAGLTLVEPAQAEVRFGAGDARGRWTPEIERSVDYYLDALNRSVTRVRLAAPQLREGSLVEQVQSRRSSTWSRTGRTVALGRGGSAVVRIRAVDRGTLYRYVSPASGHRSWSASAPAKIRLTPARLHLDTDGVTLHDVGDGTTASIVFDAVAGQRIGFAAGDEAPEGQGTELAFRVLAPDGRVWWNYSSSNEIGDDNRIMRWVAPQTGAYRVLVRSLVDDAHPTLSAVTFWASTPKVVEVTRAMMDAPATAPYSLFDADFPGQAVEVRYPADSGEVISVGYGEATCGRHTFVGPHGITTSPWYYQPMASGAINHGVLARVAGKQTYRVAPCDNVPLDGSDITVRTPTDVETATIDGGPVVVERPDAETVSVVQFHGAAGDRVHITSCAPCRVLDPDGAELQGPDGVYDLRGSGTFRVVVFPDESSTSPVSVEVTRHQGE